MNNKLPSFQSYGHYSSDNYGVNTLIFTVNDSKGYPIDIYFSYKTPVAFRHISTGLVVRENDWSTTTGKHLNWIDNGDKKSRITGDQFETQLNKLFTK